MATNGVTVQLVPHDEEEVKLYFADNIADHPVYKDNIADQQLVYKGIITLHLIGPPNFAELWSQVGNDQLELVTQIYTRNLRVTLHSGPISP